MPRRILLSIKPKFAKKIFDGSKKYEFRRVIFKDPNVNTVVVYASAPISKVIGEFSIDEVLTLRKESLWRVAKTGAGINKVDFDNYFFDKEQANALKVKKARKYRNPLCLKKDLGITYAPQSFIYLD